MTIKERKTYHFYLSMMFMNISKSLGIPLSDSEVYKHLKILINNGFIARTKTGRYGKYIITKKGMVAVEKVKEIAETESKVPKIEMRF